MIRSCCCISAGDALRRCVHRHSEPELEMDWRWRSRPAESRGAAAETLASKMPVEDAEEEPASSARTKKHGHRRAPQPARGVRTFRAGRSEAVFRDVKFVMVHCRARTADPARRGAASGDRGTPELCHPQSAEVLRDAGACGWTSIAQHGDERSFYHQRAARDRERRTARQRGLPAAHRARAAVDDRELAARCRIRVPPRATCRGM